MSTPNEDKHVAFDEATAPKHLDVLVGDSSQEVSRRVRSYSGVMGTSLEWDKREPLKPTVHGEATIFSTVVNIVNNTCGVGVLVLPYAIAKCGLGVGIIGVLLVAGLSAYGFWLIARGCEQTDTVTYKDLMIKSFGKEGWGTVTTVFLLLLTGMALVTFFVIIGIFAPNVCRMAHFTDASKCNDVWYGKGWILLAMLTPVVLLLSVMKRLNKLRYVSFVALLFLFFSIGLILARFFWLSGTTLPRMPARVQDVDDDVPWYKPGWAETSFIAAEKYIKTWKTAKTSDENQLEEGPVNFFGYLLAIAAAFNTIGTSSNCHFNTPTFYREQRNKTQFKLTTMIAFGIVLTINLTSGILGFLAFGGNEEWNIGFKADGDPTPEVETNPCGIVLESFLPEKYKDPKVVGLQDGWVFAAMVAMLGMALCLTGTVPLIFNAFRNALYDLISRCGSAEPTKEGRGWGHSTTRRWILTSACIVALNGVAVLLVYLRMAKIVFMLLTLIQALAGNPIVFVFPALTFLRNNPDVFGWRRAACYFLIGFAVLLSVFGLVSFCNDVATYA